MKFHSKITSGTNTIKKVVIAGDRSNRGLSQRFLSIFWDDYSDRTEVLIEVTMKATTFWDECHLVQQKSDI
jgi:hypothetical protein